MKNITINLIKVITAIFVIGVVFGGFVINARAATATCHLSKTDSRDILVNFKQDSLYKGNKMETYVDVNIPEGKYKIHMETWDNHNNKNQVQLNEQVFLSIYDVSGSVVLKTSNTDDIPDDINYMTTNLGTHTINTYLNIPASKIKVRHAEYTSSSDSSGSVHPVCALFERVEESKNNDDLRITCEVDDTSVDVDELVTFSVDIDGGNGPYDYNWDGDIEGEDDDEKRIRVRYDDEGRYKVEVTVRDDDGNRDSDTCPIVRVRDDDDDNNGINVISNNSGTLAGLSSVYLNQVPYTGTENIWKVILFISITLLFAAIVAMQFLKRYKKDLRSININAFKKSNWDRRNR